MSLDPIAKTAYYCCGVRADDARSARPLCGDMLAERFMDEEARRIWKRLAHLRGPNRSNAARHRLVDDWLRERFTRDPDAPVVLLGAGFDTRAFRLPGGRWVEFDQPALVALKEQVLPAATAPRPLQRIGIDFARQQLADVLAPWAGTEDATVVMEGVSMYLGAAAQRENAQVLHALLPRHRLICDLIDERFALRFGKTLRREIQREGGDFAPLMPDPASFVRGLGYREQRRRSVVAATAELSGSRVLRWLLRRPWLETLREGFQLYEFVAVDG
jgi:methyltransferase (TIGR00027 family)